MSDLENQIKAAIRLQGAHFNPSVSEKTREIYKELITQTVKVPAKLDLRYGPHQRNVLDVYGEGPSGPVVLFIHGGGYSGGDKRGADGFYENVGQAFASRGIQAVLANYRLTPDATWPSGINDVRAAVSWICSELNCGKDGRPLVLIGQSAGATHVAGYIFDESTHAEATQSLAGCVLLSGLYRMEQVALPGAISYFDTKARPGASTSPIRHVRQISYPLLITVSEFDPPEFAWHSYDLARAIAQTNNKGPAFRWFEGHNHVSTVLSFGSPDTQALDTLCSFIGDCAADF